VWFDVSNHTATYPREIANPDPLPAGGWTQFIPARNNQILVRVGISFMNIQQACRNAESEIPDFDFEAVREAAEYAWRDKLSVIEIDTAGVGKDIQTLFWSGVYRSMISPQDYTGENPLWKSTEPYYDSFYCIWDSFRSTHPLLTLIDPESQTRMVRALIDIYRFEGECSIFGTKKWTKDNRLPSRLQNVIMQRIHAGWFQCRRCHRRRISQEHYTWGRLDYSISSRSQGRRR
jgi:putative alpha-1,2-mannosidase